MVKLYFSGGASQSAVSHDHVSALTSHSSTYISEITHGDYRQMLLSLTTVYFSLGYSATSGANLMFSWTEAGLIFAILFSILCTLAVVLVPESPHWLAVIRLDSRRAKNTMKKLNPEHAVRHGN